MLAIWAEDNVEDGAGRGPFQRSDELVRFEVPHPDPFISASGGEELAIQAESTADHIVGSTFERKRKWRTCRNVPELDFTRRAPGQGSAETGFLRHPEGDKPFAVWGPGHRGRNADMSLHCEQVAVRQPPKIMPFKTAEVGFARLGTMTVQ